VHRTKQTKHILTDADGVLVDWLTGFGEYMAARGFVRKPNTDHEYVIGKRYEDLSISDGHAIVHEYNNSSAIRNMPPMPGAQENIAALAEEGYTFTVITSLSDQPHARDNRIHNLETHFGKIFNDVICIKTGRPKVKVLTQWKDTGLLWVEDHPNNAVDGHTLGLSPVLIAHEQNAEFNHPEIPVVSGWADIYKMLR